MRIDALALAPETLEVPFALDAPCARVVSLALFRNEWSPHSRPTISSNPHGPTRASLVTDLLPLAKIDENLWRCGVRLRPGWYEYLFLVDGKWVFDPTASDICPDGAGGHNCARRVEFDCELDQRRRVFRGAAGGSLIAGRGRASYCQNAACDMRYSCVSSRRIP